MKRILIAGACALAVGGQAIAADLPLPGPPPATYVPAPFYNWGGLYLGINGGYGFGDSNWNDPNNPNGVTGNFKTSGFLGGGTLGANFQFAQFVVGVEGDFDGSNLKGSSSSVFCTSFAGSPSCQTESNWLGTARGRVGYAVDRILLFATGGAAFGNVQSSLSNLPLHNTTEYGWTAGAGVEAALARNITVKIEYLYVSLNNGTCSGAASCGTDVAGPPTIVATDSVKFTESLVRAGINYKFSF
jgi:outer membrane immunogenic protein